MNILRQYCSGAFLVLGLWLGGCATVSVPAARWMPVDDQGRLAGTGFAAVDLMVACRDIDEVLQAMGSTPGFGGLTIVVEPVENDTRFKLPEVAFNQAIHGQLRSSAPRRCRLLQSDSDLEPQIVPQMYLMSRLQRVLPDRPRDHERLFYSYRLVDASNNEVFWAGATEVKTYLSAAAAETMLTAETSVER